MDTTRDEVRHWGRRNEAAKLIGCTYVFDMRGRVAVRLGGPHVIKLDAKPIARGRTFNEAMQEAIGKLFDAQSVEPPVHRMKLLVG